jgi:hypothetical protein
LSKASQRPVLNPYQGLAQLQYVGKKRGIQMLKRHRLNQDNLAIVRKPQYQAYSEVQDLAIQELTNWFSAEFKIHRHNSRILAEEIVPKAIQKKQQAIQPSAPNVYLNKRDVLESVILEAKKLSEEMDSRDELEAILDAHQNREDAEKHGL